MASKGMDSYINKKSLLHSVNPTIKFITIILLIVLVFSSSGLFINIVLTLATVMLMILCRLPWKTVKTILISVAIMFCVLFLINWISLKSPGLAIYDHSKVKTLFFMDEWATKLPGNYHGYVGISWGTKYLTGDTAVFTGDGFNYIPTSHDNIWQITASGSLTTIKDNLLKANPGWKIMISQQGKSSLYDVVFYKTSWYSLSGQILFFSLNVTFKIFLMVSIVTVLVSSTTYVELTYAVNNVLSPLRIVKAPVTEWAMIISLAIRFVPTLLQESQTILNAQSSRGCDFGNGSIKQKGKALISLIIPMFTISFLKSNDLANAMDVRSYNPRFRRTIYRTYKIRLLDYFFISIFCVFIGFVFSLAIGQHFISFFGYTDILLRYGVS